MGVGVFLQLIPHLLCHVPLQVGQPANFVWQYSGAPGTTTCTYNGILLVNTPSGDGCQSPLTLAPQDLASEPVFEITFVDACGNKRVDTFKLTRNKVITQSKVDDPLVLKGLVGVGSVTVTPPGSGAGGLRAGGQLLALAAAGLGAVALL
jgi:hypothetical protein